MLVIGRVLRVYQLCYYTLGGRWMLLLCGGEVECEEKKKLAQANARQQQRNAVPNWLAARAEEWKRRLLWTKLARRLIGRIRQNSTFSTEAPIVLRDCREACRITPRSLATFYTAGISERGKRRGIYCTDKKHLFRYLQYCKRNGNTKHWGRRPRREEEQLTLAQQELCAVPLKSFQTGSWSDDPTQSYPFDRHTIM